MNPLLLLICFLFISIPLGIMALELRSARDELRLNWRDLVRRRYGI